jgi:hypothetical protein
MAEALKEVALLVNRVREILRDEVWNDWARQWLDGTDRSADSALRQCRRLSELFGDTSLDEMRQMVTERGITTYEKYFESIEEISDSIMPSDQPGDQQAVSTVAVLHAASSVSAAGAELARESAPEEVVAWGMAVAEALVAHAEEIIRSHVG